MHVRALMKGVGSMKMYRKEGSERRPRGDAGFANKANPPPAGCAPAHLPPSPLPPGTAGEGREGEGGGRGKEGRDGGEREGRERGSENERQGLVCGKDGSGREGASLTPRSQLH